MEDLLTDLTDPRYFVEDIVAMSASHHPQDTDVSSSPLVPGGNAATGSSVSFHVDAGENIHNNNNNNTVDKGDKSPPVVEVGAVGL